MANRVMADPPNADANADATTRAICGVVDLWTSVDRLTDECSSTQYIKLCNESRGDGGDHACPCTGRSQCHFRSVAARRAGT